MKKKNSLAVAIEGDTLEDSLVGIKGNGHIADLIVKTAKRFNVPVVKSPKLAEILNQLPSDEPIPTELIPALEIVVGEL